MSTGEWIQVPGTSVKLPNLFALNTQFSAIGEFCLTDVDRASRMAGCVFCARPAMQYASAFLCFLVRQREPVLVQVNSLFMSGARKL